MALKKRKSASGEIRRLFLYLYTKFTQEKIGKKMIVLSRFEHLTWNTVDYYLTLLSEVSVHFNLAFTGNKMKRMMKPFLITLAASLLAVSCVFNSWVGVCTENGIDYTEVRDVKAFLGLSSSLPCKVYYTQGAQQEVRIESTREFAGKVLTELEDGVLKLRLEEGRYPKLILRVAIISPDIESISVRGSGNVIVDSSLVVSKDLILNVSGSGNIVAGDIRSKDLSTTIRGSGDISIASLACAGFDATVGGSGRVEIEALTATDDASACISGSGRICLYEVTVDGDMDLQTFGSGSILVNGRCHDVDAATSGSGSIFGSLSHTGIRTHSSGSGHINLQ